MALLSNRGLNPCNLIATVLVSMKFIFCFVILSIAKNLANCYKEILLCPLGFAIQEDWVRDLQFPNIRTYYFGSQTLTLIYFGLQIRSDGRGGKTLQFNCSYFSFYEIYVLLCHSIFAERNEDSEKSLSSQANRSSKG